MSRVDDFFLNLKKAELHLHLEGSVSPETMCELDPGLSLDQVRAQYRYSGFNEFLLAYKWVVGFLRTPEDYALVTTRLLQQLEAQEVCAAEINLSVGVVLWKKQDAAAIYSAVQEAAAGSKVAVSWIFDAVRQFGPERAMRVAELAAERVREGVVGFGIGGDETRVPAFEFAEVFRFARNRGLHLAPHAGETSNSTNVWDMLKQGAERIGHGIRAVDDAALMRHLAANGIPLEICISSNVCTGAVPTVDAHPVRRLFDAGVPLVLNTDDPAMFHTTLEREFGIARSHFGFSDGELRLLAANSLRYRFGSV